MKIIIIGGTPTALTLANLLGDEHEITIIEEDPENAKKIANATAALVVEGEGTDVNILNQAGITQADAVIATSDDKTNLMICEIAKNEEVKKVITLVNEPKNEELFQKLGITQLVSAVGTNVTGIKNLLKQVGDTRIIAQLGQGEMQIAEVTVTEGSSLVEQLPILSNAVIAAIYRNGEHFIPKGDTKIQVGDVLIIVVRTEDLQKIQELIQGK